MAKSTVLVKVTLVFSPEYCTSTVATSTRSTVRVVVKCRVMFWGSEASGGEVQCFAVKET